MSISTLKTKCSWCAVFSEWFSRRSTRSHRLEARPADVSLKTGPLGDAQSTLIAKSIPMPSGKIAPKSART
jgi:hypothetical protein